VHEAMQGAEAFEATFRDLGMHQLHGLPGPEALFQVVVADLPTDFPPPRIGLSGPAKPAVRRRPRRAASEEAGR
jgi:hypothetical protein